MNKKNRILLAKLLGYIHSDGFFTNRGNGVISVGFCNNDINLIKDFSDSFQKVFLVKIHLSSWIRNNKKNYTLKKQDEKIIKIIKSFNIFSFNKKEKCAYLSGLYDGDGSVSFGFKKDGQMGFRIRFHNKDKKLIKIVLNFLNDIGIENSKIYSEKIRGYGKGTFYNISITNQKDAKIFYDNIKLKSRHKIEALKNYLKIVKIESSEKYPLKIKIKALELHKNGLGCRKIGKMLNIPYLRITRWYSQFDDKNRYNGYPARWGYKNNLSTS
jgi:hypothetical protein